MRQHRTNSATLLLLAAFLATPKLAIAQEQNQAAVDLAYEGKERFEAADYASALERFEKARALAGAPVLDLYVARSLKALGRWKEALVAYDAAGTHLVDGSNVSFVQAQENAKKERKELAAKMPKLSVTAPHVPSATPPELHIDAEPVSWPADNVALDPGKHVLAATLKDQTYDEVVTLSPGERLTVELPFGKSEDKPVSQPPPAEGAEGKRGISPLAWTAFGIGAAGLIVGATAGTWALVNMGSLNEHCAGAGNPCPNGVPDDDDYRSLKNTTAGLATTADIGFIVAGAGALLGVTFALTLGKGEKAASSSAHLELRPAGSGVMLSGAF